MNAEMEFYLSEEAHRRVLKNWRMSLSASLAAPVLDSRYVSSRDSTHLIIFL